MKILGITVAVILALALGVVLTINVIPGETYKGLIGTVVKSTTGRDLVIDGDFDIGLGSSFRVVASGVHLGNAAWGSRPDMFSARLVEGEVRLAPLLRGVLDARLVLDAPDLLLETDAEGRGNWQMGGAATEEETPAKAAADEGDGFALRPFIRELRLDEVKVAYLDARADRQHHAAFDTIRVNSREDLVDVVLQGRIDDHAVSLKGGLDSAATAAGKPPAGFTLAGDIGDVSLNAGGTLDAISASASVDLVLEASVPSVAALSALAGRDLPEEGPLNATIHVTGGDGHYSADRIDVNLGAEMLTASVRGGVSDLVGLSGIDLDIAMNTTRLGELFARVGVETPVELPRALDARAKVSGSLDELAVSSYHVDLQDEGVMASAVGRVENVMPLRGLAADVSLDAVSLKGLSKYAGTELPDLGRLQASASVNSEGETFAVSDIRAELAGEDLQAKVEGSLGDAVALQQLDASVEITLVSLAALDELTGQELPDSGPISLSGNLASPQGPDAQSEVSGTLSGDGVRASFSGTIADLAAAEGISIAIEAAGDSLQQVAKLAGRNIPRREPVALKGTLDRREASYKFDKLEFQLGDNVFTGAAELTPPAGEGGRTALSGSLHLGALDLDALLGRAAPGSGSGASAIPPEANAIVLTADNTVIQSEKPAGVEQTAGAEAGAGTPVAADAPQDKGKKIFSSEPLPLEALRGMDAEIKVTADEIGTVEMVLKDVTATMALANGLLKVEPVQAKVGDGVFDADLVLDASRSPARLSFNVDMDDGTTRYFGGRYNLTVDVDGAGDSVAQLMAGLDGRVIVDVRELGLKKSFMTNFGRGLIDTLNPFDSKSDETELVCAIARFDIHDGIANADDRIVAQLTKVTWFGGGQVNLRTEAIDLGAKSKPRSGLGINVVAQLAGLVHIGGTLASPKVVPDPAGVAKQYGEHFLAVTTGGLYLLVKGLWDKSQANSDVCAEILAFEEKERGMSARADAEPEQNVAARAEAALPEDAGSTSDGEPESKVLLDSLDHR